HPVGVLDTQTEPVPPDHAVLDGDVRDPGPVGVAEGVAADAPDAATVGRGQCAGVKGLENAGPVQIQGDVGPADEDPVGQDVVPRAKSRVGGYDHAVRGYDAAGRWCTGTDLGPGGKSNHPRE